jgi:hypothetical protein
MCHIAIPYPEKRSEEKDVRLRRCLNLLMLLPLVVLIQVSPVIAVTNVSGPISSDTTWILADSPYYVTGTVTVNPGVTLTLERGVIVKFNQTVWIDRKSVV